MDTHGFPARVRRCVAGGALLLAATGDVVLAQRQGVPDSGLWRAPVTLVTAGSVSDDSSRTAQLLGGSADGQLLRSPSSRTSASDTTRRLRLGVIAPQLRFTSNSELPWSINDGSLWAGRGSNLYVLAGAVAQFGKVRLILAPELTHSQNGEYALADTIISPPAPASRNPFSSPWHASAQSIDLPIRFGDGAFTRLGPGQSSLSFGTRHVTAGAATENEWWGPGIRNALLLSNNAAGFPHLFVRTSAPIQTRIGAIEGRWLAGGLTESAYYDYDPTNDLRAITLLGVTLRPSFTPNVVVGAARSVFSATDSWAAALAGFPRVFRDVGHPNAVPPGDSTHLRGHDALISLFGRWRLPASGAEIYAEWARAEMPFNLRDFLIYPTHTQGYTIGFQWIATPIALTGGRFRLQAEGTTVEQSTTFRFKNLGSWYASRTVEQGYTERGQTLGAAIGPGSSSQWIAVDHLAPRWELGAYVVRVRWLQDVRSYKTRADDTAYCGQDVSLIPGARGRLETPFGVLGADVSSGWRLNVFFEQRGTCFELPSRDQRNRSVSLTFSPSLSAFR